ncbi:MAG: iron chelate uptake ABC transporter family permease subunit, partial [Candidatus Verstraetearchaeota archaeon]|nr:iron chelate uptake ABC transporter family permease subunit [Candidatus Verstraetearchaeota archaeon]
KSLGVDVDRVRKLGLVFSCLSAATIVSFTGAIGFIGLISPHICRFIVGGDERLVITGSTAVGAIILLSSDLIARRLMAPIILPVGAVTAFLGGPFLLYLLLRLKRAL